MINYRPVSSKADTKLTLKSQQGQLKRFGSFVFLEINRCGGVEGHAPSARNLWDYRVRFSMHERGPNLSNASIGLEAGIKPGPHF